MTIGKPKPTEYKVDKLKAKDFFDARFVELIKDKIEDAKFEHFCLVILGKKEGEEKESILERLYVGHELREDEANKITTVGASKPDTCELLLDAVKKFIQEKESTE